MNRIALLAAALALLVLSACAGGPGVGQCSGSSICPLVIYEKYPGLYAVFPDRMGVQKDADTGQKTLIWTFADQTKYKFSAKTDTVRGDGVEFIGTSGAMIKVQPCFITNNSKDELSYVPEGIYYRCEVSVTADFKPTAYRIRFRTKEGSPRVVDPYVESTGGGDFVPAAGPIYTTVAVNVGSNETIPPLGGFDGVKIIWNAGSGAMFKEANGGGVQLKESTTGDDPGVQPCFITSDAAGSVRSTTGQYFMCVAFTAARPLGWTYSATFNDASGLKSVPGSLTRP